MNGIEEFWQTLMPEVCTRYIMHLHKVMPKIILSRLLQILVIPEKIKMDNRV